MHDRAMDQGPPAQQRLACIGDASRFRLVVALAAGERCVTELAAAVGLSQSCTTRHLQTLHAAGLVHRNRYGKRVMVGLRRDEPELRPLFEYVLALAKRSRSASGAGRPAGPAAGPAMAPEIGGAGGSGARSGLHAARGAVVVQTSVRRRGNAPVPATPPPQRRAAPVAGSGVPAEALRGQDDVPATPRRFEPLEDFLL